MTRFRLPLGGIMSVRARTAAAFTLSVFLLAGCGDANDPLAPAPSAERNATSTIEFCSTEGTGEAVTGTFEARVRTMSRVLTPAGGRLSLHGHEVIVPQGAATGLTLFEMTVLDGDYVGVDLRAYEWHPRRGIGDEIDDFSRADLTLRLTYRWADDADELDDANLSIHALDDGCIDAPAAQQSVDHERRWVEGLIDHFSGYIMVAG